MTILGSHTIDETEHLMKLVEYRIQQGNKANASITQDQVNVDPLAMLDLQSDWTAFQVRWATMRDPVLKDLTSLSLGQPLVSDTLIASESQYQKVLGAINTGPNGSIAKGDLSDCLSRIERIGHVVVDLNNQPLPTGFDPDLAVYKTADATIKQGKAIASAAVDGAASANADVNNGILGLLSANIGKVVVGGILVAGGLYAYTKVVTLPAKELVEKL